MVPAIAPSADYIRPQQYGRLLNGGSVFGATLSRTLKGLSKATAVGAVTFAPVTLEPRQEDRRDQSARRDAKALLDELELLQRDLLGSGGAADHLPRIATLAARLSPVDADLAEICQAISMRARVEMARLQRSAQTSRA